MLDIVGELNESFKQNQELSLKIKDNEIEYLKNYYTRCYSPYSKFNVVSMIKLNNNKKFYGVNVENCSFSVTICSEINSLSNLITAGENPKNIDYIIIMTNTADTIVPLAATPPSAALVPVTSRIISGA